MSAANSTFRATAAGSFAAGSSPPARAAQTVNKLRATGNERAFIRCMRMPKMCRGHIFGIRMHRMKALSLPVALSLFTVCAAPAGGEEPAAKLPAAAARNVEFAADIQPLFQKNCFSCHGPEHQEGGLRLDQRKRALDGGDSGAEIVAGKSADSRLVRLIAGVDEDFSQMPPKEK